MSKQLRTGSVGPLNAKIMFVGEAWGAEEEIYQQPFKGKAGKIFDATLIDAKIKREEVYITNVVNLRPPNNDLKRLNELGRTIESFYPELKQEIETVKPNIVVALGNTPLWALCSKDKITKWRGSVLESTLVPGMKVIPTLHPSYLLRGNMESCALVVPDLCKVRRESETSQIILPHRTFHLEPKFSDAIEYLHSLANEKYLSIDLETPRKPPYYIKCFGLGHTPDFAMCIPFVHGSKVWWNESQEVAIWEQLRTLLQKPCLIKVAQNQMFELSMLKPWVGEINPIIDTMIMHHLCYPELPKGLDTLASLYTNEPYFKDESEENLWKYNCKDVTTTLEIAIALERELKELGMFEFYHGYQAVYAKTLWRATEYGVLTDKNAIKEHLKEIDPKIELYQKGLDALVGYPINARSPNQIKQLLYDEMKLPKRYNRKTHSVSANQEVLEKFAITHPSPTFDLILKVRKYKTLKSTFAKDNSDEDGRIRTSYTLSHDVTGRIASRKNIRKTGANMQNIPEEMRNIFISDSGTIFIAGDLWQAEAMVVAWLANDPRIKTMLKSGKKIHSEFGAWTYQVAPDQLTPQQYKISKRIIHATNYDMGPDQLAYHAGVTRMVGKELRQKYNNFFMGLESWKESIRKQLSYNRTLITPQGRRRQFFGMWNDALFRAAYAHIPQATVADLIGHIANALSFRLPKSAMVLLQVHDELINQARTQDEQKVVDLFQAESKRPMIINGDILTIPLEVKVGINWRDLHEQGEEKKSWIHHHPE